MVLPAGDSALDSGSGGRLRVAANFGVPESALAYIPSKQRYIFQSEVPGPLESEKVPDPYGSLGLSFKHRLLAQNPIRSPGGTVRIVDSTNFPIATRVAAALAEIEPGGMRELHWHPNNGEWQYFLSGVGRMTVFAANATARTFDVRAGDVGYIPFAFGHYIQNTGPHTLWFLEMFKSDRFADLSFNQWMSLTPQKLVQDNVHASPELMNALRKEKWPVMKFRDIQCNSIDS